MKKIEKINKFKINTESQKVNIGKVTIVVTTNYSRIPFTEIHEGKVEDLSYLVNLKTGTPD